MPTMRVFLAIALCLCSCTENARARNWGGTTTVDVKAGQKVIGATWKDHDLWIIHRPMHDGEVPEVVTMTESSSFGYLEGHVVIREHAAKVVK
jgi:hypothetical protein